MVWADTRISSTEWDAWNSPWFSDKKTNHLIPTGRQLKIKEKETIDKYLYLAKELKKMWNMEVTEIPIEVEALRNGPQELWEGTGRIGNQGWNRDYLDYSIADIGQNTEKSPANLKRLKWKTTG